MHGDERGFRSRRHHLHSSGDYKDPPPPGEDAGLHRYHADGAGVPVNLSLDARVIIREALVLKWQALGYRIIVCSVGERHLQSVVKGPHEYAAFIKEVGRPKQAASHAVRPLLPGTVWAANGGFKPIRGRGHCRNSYKYVRTRQ